MTAYNKVNGFYMGANRPLVRGTLFGSFGFDGFVLSDFYAGGDTVGSALAGQSLALPQPQYYEPALLRAAIADGRLTTATIDDLVRRYLRVLFRFGVFDRAAYPRDATIPVKRHGRVARQVEDRGHRPAAQPPLAAAAERPPDRLGGRDRQVGRRVPAPQRGVERRSHALLRGHRSPGPAARRARALRGALRGRKRPRARRPRGPPSRRGGGGGRARRAVGRVLGPPLHRPRLRAQAAAPGSAHTRGGGGQPADGGGAPVTRAGHDALGPQGGGDRGGVVAGRGGRQRNRRRPARQGQPVGQAPRDLSAGARPTCRRAPRAVPGRRRAARSTRRACSWAIAGTTGRASARCSRSGTASPTRASTTAT